MNYTKGKWEYEEELQANFSMISGGDTVICGMVNPLESETYEKELTEMRANAHLILAAPDMYEALDEAKHIVWSYKEIEKANMTIKAYEDYCIFYQKILRILVKAEGK
jgi:hypothetical protein